MTEHSSTGTAEFLPCPLCKSELLDHRAMEEGERIKCVDCGLELLDWNEKVIDLWNARVPAQSTQWQPIETAPKDGTHILAYRLPIGIRFTNNTNPPTVVHWFDDPDEPGFYTSVNERAPEYPFNPTHWKPLDAPPGPALPSTSSGTEPSAPAPETSR
jgi:hypothetical protein